jgi:hypothetical protein
MDLVKENACKQQEDQSSGSSRARLVSRPTLHRLLNFFDKKKDLLMIHSFLCKFFSPPSGYNPTLHAFSSSMASITAPPQAALTSIAAHPRRD